jgi:hypothetical protein
MESIELVSVCSHCQRNLLACKFRSLISTNSGKIIFLLNISNSTLPKFWRKRRELAYIGYSASRAVVLGIVSGMISAIIVFLLLARLFPPVSGIRGFISIASTLKSATGASVSAFTLDLIARMILGLVVGGIFGAVVARPSQMPRTGRIVGLGIIAGIVTWFLLSVLGVVAYDEVQGMALSATTMMYYLGYSFVRYFVFGLIMGLS